MEPTASAPEPFHDPDTARRPGGDSPRPSVLRPAIIYAILFGAQGAYLPYVSVFLASTGLELGTVGALIALYAGVSLVAAPAWGSVADGLGDVRGPVLVASVLSTLAVGLLSIATSPLSLAVAIVCLAATFGGIVPMVDSQTVRLVGQRDRFGIARAPGSATFVVVAFATGAILAVTGPRGMFLLYAPLVAAVGVSAWFLMRLPRASQPRRRVQGVGHFAGRALAGLSPRRSRASSVPRASGRCSLPLCSSGPHTRRTRGSSRSGSWRWVATRRSSRRRGRSALSSRSS